MEKNSEAVSNTKKIEINNKTVEIDDEIDQKIKQRGQTDFLMLMCYIAFIVFTALLVIYNGWDNGKFTGKDIDFDDVMLWKLRYIDMTIVFGIFIIFAFIINLIVLSLFWCAAKIVIWTINVTFMIGLFLLSARLAKINKFYGLGGICGIILAAFIIYWLRNKITAVTNTVKKSTQILFKFWNLLLVPFMTLLVFSIATRIFYQFYKIVTNPESTNNFADLTLILIGIAYIWTISLILECQNFLVISVTTKWYFAQNRENLNGWATSRGMLSQLLRYHLGSVCFGAALVTLAHILKFVFRNLKKLAEERKTWITVLFSHMFMGTIDLINEPLQYIKRSSYILISRDGTSFFKSGKKIYKVIMKNISVLIPLKLYSFFVLLICKLLIFLIIISPELFDMIEYDWLTVEDFIQEYSMILFYIFVIVHTITSVLESTVDTLIVCICIDHIESNGTRIPKSLRDFVAEFVYRKLNDVQDDVEVRIEPSHAENHHSEDEN